MNPNTNAKTVLITGASSGLGEACGKLLSSLGYTVYGTSRQATKKPVNDCTWPQLIRMDVCDDQSVADAIDFVIERSGAIDILINSAGIVYSGAIEDMSMAEFQSQMDTNFYGCVRVTKQVLPHMRSRTSGRIIHIGSAAGFMGIPFQSAYSASKFALEGFTESLRMETRPYGIQAVVVQPGDFKTGITQNRMYSENHTPDSVYFDACETATNKTIEGEVDGVSPEVLARKVERIIRKKSPKVRYTVGPLFQRFSTKAKYWVPARFFEKLIRTNFS